MVKKTREFKFPRLFVSWLVVLTAGGAGRLLMFGYQTDIKIGLLTKC